MNCKSLVKRVMKNLRIDSEDTALISEVRIDLADTIRAMKLKAESVNKAVCLEVAETVQKVYDFSSLPSNSSLSVFTNTNDRLEITNAQSGIFTLTKQYKPISIEITVGGTWTAPPGTTIMTLLIEVLSGQGTVLYSGSNNVGDISPATFVITPEYSADICDRNFQVRVTLTSVEGTLTLGYIDDLKVTTSQNEVKLPDDWFIPLGIEFNANTSSTYKSVEVNPDTFVKTVVNNLDSDATLQTVYTPTEQVKPVVYNAIIYYLDTRADGVYLVYKNSFTGTIDVTYIAIENICCGDDDGAGISSAFVDAVVSGATVRGLKRIMLTVTEQVQMIAIRSLTKDYKFDYIENLKDYVGATQETITPILATPFMLGNFYDDDVEVW